uniref:BBS7 platform domain-containing protein n=1 Tax=Photinus pyralis TaxID=7054 RepID=A0A1Y1NJL7_PHOPY
MHFRVHSIEKKRPFNLLTIKGPFSLAEIHSWVFQCVPEVPEKPQFIDATVLFFESTFLGTHLECNFQKGEAKFASDNISTISIIREFLTKEATKKKIKIDINVGKYNTFHPFFYAVWLVSM